MTGTLRQDDTPPGVRTRVVMLGSDLAGARSARTALRDLLTDDEREQWLDAAELACTELVTNAVLHAHTDITVTLTVEQDDDPGLRVEVTDLSPDLPLQRVHDREATTGRGMALVAALSNEHGVRSDGAHGKTVWFLLRATPVGGSSEDLLAAWDDGTWDLDDMPPEPPQGDDEAGHAAGGAAESVEGLVEPLLVVPRSMPGRAASEPGAVAVRLDQLPPTLWLAASEHHETLLRELVLFLAPQDGAPAPVVDMRAADTARKLLSGAVAAAVQRAQQEGTARPALPEGHPAELPWVPAPLTIELLVPVDDVPTFAALQDALDLAERLAGNGRLLARPGLPEIVAVRDWACEQVLAQHRGAPVAAWPGTDQERFEAAAGDDLGPVTARWEGAPLVATEQAVVVADDTNRIVAISPAMAKLVGWSPTDLAGRRIVTLIPHALREAHVAGFSRHLTTGKAHLLGLTLTLPVLHADGRELSCSVRIDEATTVPGRRLYLAEFSQRPFEGSQSAAAAEPAP